MRDKLFALILCLSGVSMKMAGRFTGVSGQSVMRRIKMFYEKFIPEADADSRIEEIEIDEIFLYP